MSPLPRFYHTVGVSISIDVIFGSRLNFYCIKLFIPIVGAYARAVFLCFLFSTS